MDAVAEEIHDRASPDQRNGNGNSGYEGRPRIAQENKNYGDHQDDGKEEGALNILYGSADRGGPVENHRHVHSLRSGRLDPRYLSPQSLYRGDDVRSPLSEDD